MKAATRDDGTQLPPELLLDLVALARSGPGPYDIQAELPAPWMANVLAHTDAEVTSAGSTSLEVTPIGEGTSYLVRGTIQGGYSVPCARCLAPAPVSAGGEICVHFVRDRVGDADDEESETESPDQRSFSGTHIDLRPLLVEQVELSYPIRALCAYGEACRGLCMRCGAELNGQPLGPCAACGAVDAQVPIAADADLEAQAKPTTSWQAALQQLAGAGADDDEGDTSADNLPLDGAIPGDDEFDPDFGEPEPRPGDRTKASAKAGVAKAGPPGGTKAGPTGGTTSGAAGKKKPAKPAGRSSAKPAGKATGKPATKSSAGAGKAPGKSPGKKKQ